MKQALIFSVGVVGLCAMAALAKERTKEESAATAKAPSEAKSVYDFTVKDIDGKDVKLSDYKGKVCLIVNVASQ
jgi:glutathione peroxidase